MSEELYTLSEQGEGEGPQQAGPLALDIKRLISLRLPLMIAVCLVCAIPGALLAWYMTPIVYTATAEVRFRADEPRVIENGRGGNQGSYDNFVNTQIALITGAPILSKVVDRLDLSQIPSLKDAEDPVDTLKSAVTARPRGRSELVTVTCTLPGREDAKTVLDTLLETYLEYAILEAKEMGSERQQTLISERDTLQTLLNSQRTGITENELELGISVVGMESPEVDKISQLRGKILDLEETVADLKRAEDEQASNVEAIDALLTAYNEDPDDPISERNVEGRVAVDPDVSRYRELLFAAKDSFRLIDETYRPEHPRHADAKQLRDTREVDLRLAEQKARGQVLSEMLTEADFLLEQARKAVADGEERITAYEQELADTERKRDTDLNAKSKQLSSLNELKQNAADTRSRLTTVRDQLDEIQREEKAPARITKVSDPRMPNAPNYSKHFKMVLAALMLSGGLGVGAGVARELTDKQLRSSKDVTRLTRLPVIASIPHADEDEFLQAAHVPLLTMDHPSSMAADEYRRILSRLLYPPDETTEISSLLIASPSSGDGKTSLSCNLAIALTQAHRQVLLVDISSQQPAIEACFGLSASMGLAEMLREESPPEQCLRQTEYDGLFVMGPGLRTQDLASRLASRRMTNFLEWAEQRFDHVIIDSPPSLLMSDSKLLAPLTDGVIVVIGAGVSSIGMVRRCLQEMEQLKANVLGVVLNGIRVMRGGYLGNRRRLFYAYYQGTGNGHNDSDLPEMEIMDDEGGLEPVVVLLPADEEEDRSGGSGHRA